jgi:hypothetical protein
MLVRVASAVCISLVLFMVGAVVVQPRAAELEDHLGPLASAASLGRDGAWETSIANGWAMFSNTTDPGSMVYYHAAYDRLSAGERTVSVNLALRGSGATPQAGLLFDYSDAKHFVAMTVKGNGSVAMLAERGNGVEEMGVSEKVRARMDGSDILEIKQKPNSAEFLLNGEKAFELNNDKGFAPGVGIFMGGTGRFAFTAFKVETTGGIDPFPPPKGGSNDSDPFPPPAGGGTADTGTEPKAPPTGPGTPERQPTPQEIYVSKVLAGTTLGVFFHELGHAVIGELKIPATGPEEDVADEFSAFVLGAVFEEEANLKDPMVEDLLEGIVTYSSLLWYYNGVKMEKQGQTEPWQGEHAPSLRRFRNSFCIIYGGNPQRFEDLATKVKFDDRTKARCLQDYKKRYQAWETLLKPVSRNLGPDSPGDYPADAPGGKVLLTFQEPSTDVGRAVAGLLRETNVMKEIAGFLEKGFVWPRDFQIEFRDCQEINAWYDPQAGKVTFCYSIVEFFSKTVFEAEGAAGTPSQQPPDTRRTPLDGRVPDPRQPPAQKQPTAEDAMAFFVGVWQATMQGPDGSITGQVTYAKDRSYHLMLQSPYGTTEIVGSWSAVPLGPKQVQISANPQNWEPKQICNAYGYCQPNPQYPSQIVVQLIDQNSVSAEGIVWRRLQ